MGRSRLELPEPHCLSQVVLPYLVPLRVPRRASLLSRGGFHAAACLVVVVCSAIVDLPAIAYLSFVIRTAPV